MNTTDYVSYPLALALKEAGFDEPCIAMWAGAVEPDGIPALLETTTFVFENSEYSGRDACAPLLWQAQKWLREKKDIPVVPARACGGKFILYIKTTKFDMLDQLFDTYEQALSAGIAAALELIEKKGDPDV